MNLTVASIAEMKEFAAKMLAVLNENVSAVGYKKAVIVGLSGDLGSGKTTFSQCVAELLGIAENVTSPTFVIEKIYKTKDVGRFETFIHIDAYRLESGKEIETLGFKNIINAPNTLVFIEWPEKIEEVLPSDSTMVKFKFIDENTREISY
jgi:tRNA threonylcarbamoyladenosine biosynthesis protein TsaE